ncbi:UDP-glucuronosyltransferase [Nitrosopumilus sp. K4]|uniref:glycosyltransferase n=1 Tax=Nitrosopumilus sp. K4 TaxID=2795383 RepID=UPI001BA55447|nr:glycosyltransferase [Nitrosopumilus sp. K4]QUC64351.1 UDP-glucuronosyltransferase [Nitrosopumilus sp. K4]
MVDIDFFSSPIGLGHATRDIAIAKQFQDISLKFVTGSGAAKIIQDSSFNVENLYMPPKFIVENGKLKSPAKWLWSYFQYYKECKKISKKIIEKDNPRIVLSDEDFASLTIAQKKKIPTVLITDILETHFVRGIGSFIEKKMNKSMQNIIEKCELVILPEFGENKGNIKRVGPITRHIKYSREELRKKFSFDKKTILISVGGTDAGLFLIEKTLDAVKKINSDVKVVVVSGPSLQKDFEKYVTNLGYVDNLHEFIFASDLLISLAGKSTIDEAKAYGTPAIFIPIKGHFEQEDNAREEGFEFEDIFKLETMIEEKLTQKRTSVYSDGASKAAKLITDLIK